MCRRGDKVDDIHKVKHLEVICQANNFHTVGAHHHRDMTPMKQLIHVIWNASASASFAVGMSQVGHERDQNWQVNIHLAA